MDFDRNTAYSTQYIAAMIFYRIAWTNASLDLNPPPFLPPGNIYLLYIDSVIPK